MIHIEYKTKFSKPKTNKKYILLQKVDPMTMAMMGFGGNMDPALMKAAGFDPKNPNSMMAAMAAMDPNMAALYGSYGLNPSMMAGVPGMDMLFGTKAKTSTTNSNPTTTKAGPSSSPRASPRPPSRASVKSDDRRSPRTSVPSSSVTAPRTSTPSSSLNSAAAALGLDPKMMQAMGINEQMLKSMGAMDPNLLKAAGLDPKSLGSLDPKMLGK